MVWRCGTRGFDLERPLVMGILNVTPDSFSDGGEHDEPEAAVAFAERLVADGAHVVDVGGESTRPGSDEVAVEEELRRVVPVVRELVARGIPVSVDTRHVEVARASVEAGACILNDVSGFRDPAMRELAAGCDAGLVAMHMLGEPKGMQESPAYADVVDEVERYLLDRAALLEQAGVARERICIDPGVGFGKTVGHNRALLQATARLAGLGYTLAVAVSRKSFIGAETGVDVPSERDEASALCAAAACLDGARVVRTHNPALTHQMLDHSFRAVVGMGSNMGDRAAHLDAAVAQMKRIAGTWLVGVSSYVETAPAYYEDQGAFANAVAVLQTVQCPYDLLAALHRIEDGEGRVRELRNGPRTLDLDLLDFERVVHDDPELTLPHPGVLERDFVVRPLLELLPGYVLADGSAVTADGVRVGHVTGRLPR